MVTLAELQESLGISTEPVVRPLESRMISTGKHTEDTRCPRCKMVRLTPAERCAITSYSRSVCVGVMTCSDCGGQANGVTVYCEKCRDKGYVLRFEKRWFDYACSACVYEARRARCGLSKASVTRFTSVPTVTVTYHVPTPQQVMEYKERVTM